MNYICTRNKEFFNKVGNYNFIELSDIKLPNIISLDTETTGLKTHNSDIFCIQVGTGRNNVIFDLQENSGITIQDVWPLIKDSEWVLQNAAFDLGFFYKHNLWPKKVWDTFLASKILYNGGPSNIRHDFGSIMKRELGIIYDKTEQKNIYKVKLSQPSTIEYSFNDVDRLIECHEKLVQKLKDYGAYPAYELHCRYIKAMAYMEQCGMPLDADLWKNKMEGDYELSQQKQREIQDYIYDNLEQYRDGQYNLFDSQKRIKVQLSSPKQMIPVFQAFKINTKNKDGKDSIEEDVIQKSKHEFVKLWLEFKKAEHSVTTFGQNILDQIYEGRIYTSFNPIIDTARISTRKGGINFLNFPAKKEVRSAFVAKEGYQMVVCDYEAQEGRISADVSQDKAMLEAILNNADLHCMFAKKIYPEIEHLTDEEIIKNHKDKRTNAKAPRFAFQYGGSGFTVATNLNIPIEEGNKLEVAFKELHSGIYTWGNTIYEKAIKVGYIESVDGFKLKLPDFDLFKELEQEISSHDQEFWQIYRIGKDEYKKVWEIRRWNSENPLEKKPEHKIEYLSAYNLYYNSKDRVSQFFKLKSGYQRLSLNNPVQTCGAFMSKTAMTLLFEYIVSRNHQWKVRISNWPHDEGDLEVVDELVEEYKEKLQYFMRIGGNKYLINNLFEMTCTAAAGISWQDAK